MIFLGLRNLKNKIKSSLRKSTFFQDNFGFENGIDITDDNMVLYRKNIVVKNIIFVVNIVYAIIFTIISIGDPTNSSNWLLTLLLLPVTALVNYFLGKLIKKGSQDNLSQTMAMYVAAFYMFLSSILVYVKLKYGAVESENGNNYLSEAGYILIYVSLFMCAFYQDKKMLRNIFLWVIVLITILHFTLTYQLVSVANNSDFGETIYKLVTGVELRDILIRTILLLVYMLILYIFVSMTSYMQEERKKEQAKRRSAQADYINSIKNVFDIVIPKNKISENEIKENIILCRMVKRLASILNLSEDEINDLDYFTSLYVNHNFNLELDNESTEDQKFEIVKQNEIIGEDLILRIKIKNKTEEILRRVLDKAQNDDFIKEAREEISDQRTQIIVICDIYINMRSNRPYKRSYSHKNVMDSFENNFKIYFDALIYDRFYRFNTDFEKIFDED